MALTLTPILTLTLTLTLILALTLTLTKCAQRGLAAIFVGEPKGGCTGSDALWERFPVQSLSGQPGWQDVVNWAGMHDRTWVLDMSLLRRVDQDHESNSMKPSNLLTTYLLQ